MKSVLPITIVLCTVMISVFPDWTYSQTTEVNPQVTVPAIYPNTKNAEKRKIKSTLQLPRNIRNAFSQTPFCAWYIEKMVSFSVAGKTVYQFSVNNSNLLDSEHYDCFLEKNVVTVSEED
jgi:hypothetical protein